jgi:hypothetical protein
MLKEALLSTGLAIALSYPLAAQHLDQLHVGAPPILQPQKLSETRVVDYTFAFAATPESAAPEPALLTEIATWLTANFDLPAADLLPKVKFATPEQLVAIRYRGLLHAQHEFAGSGDPATLSTGSEIVAVYDTEAQTIYLPEGWRGTTSAEVSLLVHEMVHHLQTRSQTKHACPQDREKLAFAAQDLWLERFGLSLASEFALDKFTLLLRTSCLG